MTAPICVVRVVAFAMCLAWLVAVSLATGRHTQCFPHSKAAHTRIEVKKYAFEAFPSWSAQHPDQPCPARLEDLDEYMNSEPQDPWGQPYRMLCGQSAGSNTTKFGVLSFGEDGKPNTPDDITSWD